MEQREKHPVCWKSWFRTERARSEILRLNKWFELTEIGIHKVSGTWMNEAAEGDEGQRFSLEQGGCVLSTAGARKCREVAAKTNLKFKNP